MRRSTLALVLITVPLYLTFSASSISLSGSVGDTRSAGLNLPVSVLLMTLAFPLIFLGRTHLGGLRLYAVGISAYVVLLVSLNALLYRRALTEMTYYGVQFILPLGGAFLAERLYRHRPHRVERDLRAVSTIVALMVSYIVILWVDQRYIGRHTSPLYDTRFLFFQVYNFKDYWPAANFIFGSLVLYNAFYQHGPRRWFSFGLALVFLVYFIGVGERLNVVMMYFAVILWFGALRGALFTKTTLYACVVGGTVAVMLFGGPGGAKLRAFVEGAASLGDSDAYEELLQAERIAEQVVLFRDYSSYLDIGFIGHGVTGNPGAEENRLASSQNQYVSALFKLGVLGALIFAAHIAYLLRRLWRCYRVGRRQRTILLPLSMSMILILFITAHFMHVLTNFYTGMLFYFLFGALMTLRRASLMPPPRPAV